MSSDATTTLSFNADVYRKLFPHEYLKSCISSNVRPDARKFDAARAVHIQTNVVHTAASSSLVRVGNTSVIAAVKLAVGTPAVTTPDQGEIAVQVHLTPLCSNRFNLGRPSEEAQSLGSQLMRIVTGCVHNIV
jgi:exosome complex component RRP43